MPAHGFEVAESVHAALALTYPSESRHLHAPRALLEVMVGGQPQLVDGRIFFLQITPVRLLADPERYAALHRELYGDEYYLPAPPLTTTYPAAHHGGMTADLAAETGVRSGALGGHLSDDSDSEACAMAEAAAKAEAARAAEVAADAKARLAAHLEGREAPPRMPPRASGSATLRAITVGAGGRSPCCGGGGASSRRPAYTAFELAALEARAQGAIARAGADPLEVDDPTPMGISSALSAAARALTQGGESETALSAASRALARGVESTALSPETKSIAHASDEDAMQAYLGTAHCEATGGGEPALASVPGHGPSWQHPTEEPDADHHAKEEAPQEQPDDHDDEEGLWIG